MPAYSIQLPQGVQSQIVSFASKYSVDSLVLSAIAQIASGGQQFYSDGSLVVTPFGVGVMGISKATATSFGFDATDENQNIEAGAAFFASLLQAFVGNYPLSIAAYITSVGTVQFAGGVPPLAPVQNFVYNVSTIAAQAGSPSVSAVYALSNAATVDDSAPQSAAVTGPQGINYLDSARSQAESDKNLNTLRQTLQPQLQIPDDTLGAQAWYADTGLVTGNPRIRASVQPVSFMVYLDRNDPTQFLSVPTNDQAVVKQPIEIQLNTSMATFEITSKHVYTRTPSRTGMHITLWGMQPDLISGTGTTGVFMNQFGLTDFMSTAGVNDDVAKLLTQGFKHTFLPTFNTDPQTSTGQVAITARTGDQDALNTVAGQAVARKELSNPAEAFRVAAQDAFVEFLKLFQMNGTVYYYNQNYNGVMTGDEQMSASAWSPQTGATSFQQHSRNNDVMTRGYVAMRYRNNTYLGYFKSLSWTQDAESPFQWKFNFVFQVEKTYTALYYSNVQTQINQNIAQLKATFGNPQPPPPPTGSEG
jgi:hypothetical protein